MFFEDIPVFILFKNKIIPSFLFFILTRELSVVFSRNHGFLGTVVEIISLLLLLFWNKKHWKHSVVLSWLWMRARKQCINKWPHFLLSHERSTSHSLTCHTQWSQLQSPMFYADCVLAFRKIGLVFLSARRGCIRYKGRYKSFMFHIYMGIFNENFLVLLTRHGI